MPPPGWLSATARSGRGLALPVSIGLHLVLAVAVSSVQWSAPQISVRQEPIIAWISDWRPAEQQDEVVAEGEESLPVEAPTVEPAEPQASSEVAPILPDDNEEPATEEQQSDVETQTDEVEVPLTPAPRIDWDEARRQAIATVLEQLEREGAYMTFSLDELSEDVPQAEPVPGQTVFDSPSRRTRSFLQPRKSRSAFARRISAMCNELTGGIGIFGIASLCADSDARSDLFASIKPEYLKKRPFCAAVPGMPAQIMNADGSEEFSTLKCQLVAAEE